MIDFSEYLTCNIETGELRWKKKNNRNIIIGSIAGNINSTAGHRRICINGKTHGAHQIVWCFAHGEYPRTGIDHIGKDNMTPEEDWANRSDNRIANLRLSTKSQNACNRGIASHNTSGYKGVSWSKQYQKFRAYINVNGKYKHLGHFDDAQEAYAVRMEAAKQYHGEFARAA